MYVPELIRRKRDGMSLTPEELEALVRGFLDGSVEDAQMSAFLMAVFFRGMEPAEAASMARVMRDSGKKYDLSGVPGVKTDKHSTGGVGDKVSLILAPLVASLGVIDPMMAGRGLGHSGGTLDKLDSIPGFRWQLSEKDFIEQLRTLGTAIIGQTEDFVPADRRLYALRDVTATVASIPLICGSILSKKAASGVEKLIMDVKCGSGAFMNTLDDARELARQLIRIGAGMDMEVRALVTQMNQPLGTTIGNTLEIDESVALLNGEGPADSREIIVQLAAEMLLMAGVAKSPEEARRLSEYNLDNGKAMERFVQVIEAQGGNAAFVDKPDVLPRTKQTKVLEAPRDGYVASMETTQIGVASIALGAGRKSQKDIIDHAVGLEIPVKVGDKVAKGQPLATIYHRDGRGLDECERILREALVIGEQPVAKLELVLDRLSVDSAK